MKWNLLLAVLIVIVSLLYVWSVSCPTESEWEFPRGCVALPMAEVQPPANTAHETEPTDAAPADPNQPPLLLKSIGIELGEYDPAAQTYGDIVFADNFTGEKIFTEYGHTVPADMSASGEAKQLHQPTFYVPLGTPVRSLVDGVVISVSELYGDDYSIHVAPSMNSSWAYETEHVLNPRVSVGDEVVAGQIIAEATDQDAARDGLGFVEIGILKGGVEPMHVCPFQYLDPSIKDDAFNQINGLYDAWEDYKGDDAIYDQDNDVVPGCSTVMWIGG